MRVDAHGRVLHSSQQGSARRAGSGAAFQLPPDPVAPSSTSSPHGVHSTAGMDALLALQSLDMDDEPQQRRRRMAVAHGRNLLDALDGLRVAVLNGHVPVEMLTRLSHILSAEMEKVDDPGLSTVLQEIDLRAQVEMAKLSRR